MKRPAALNLAPSLLLITLGGVVATILLSALLFLAPILGFPFVDFPRLVGGIFTSDPGIAFGLGFGIFFITGWLVFAPLLTLVWLVLPGGQVGFAGALVRGILWGLALWAVSGFLVPLFGALNRLDGLDNPGFFALGEGVLAAVGLLLGHLIYGLALALVAAMGQGVSPLDTLGWTGYRAAGEGRRATSST